MRLRATEQSSLFGLAIKFKVFLQIEGMTCSSCVHTIETNILKKPGMEEVSIALTTTKGRFKFDPEVTGVRDIIQDINVS